jgi:hypothetical protein
MMHAGVDGAARTGVTVPQQVSVGVGQARGVDADEGFLDQGLVRPGRSPGTQAGVPQRSCGLRWPVAHEAGEQAHHQRAATALQ